MQMFYAIQSLFMPTQVCAATTKVAEVLEDIDFSGDWQIQDHEGSNQFFIFTAEDIQKAVFANDGDNDENFNLAMANTAKKQAVFKVVCDKDVSNAESNAFTSFTINGQKYTLCANNKKQPVFVLAGQSMQGLHAAKSFKISSNAFQGQYISNGVYTQATAAGQTILQAGIDTDADYKLSSPSLWAKIKSMSTLNKWLLGAALVAAVAGSAIGLNQLRKGSNKDQLQQELQQENE